MTPTKTRLDIAQEMRQLADRMLDIATDLDFYGGMNPVMALYSRELTITSAVTLARARHIEARHQQANPTT